MEGPTNQTSRRPGDPEKSDVAREEVKSVSADSLSTFNALAESARRRFAEAAFAFSIPVAAAGIVGFSQSGEQPNKPTTQQPGNVRDAKRSTLENLSDNELDLLVDSYEHRPGGPGPLSDLAVQYYGQKHPEKSEAELAIWSRSVGGKEKIELLKSATFDPTTTNREHIVEVLSTVEQMLDDPLFKKGVGVILESNPGCKAPSAELAYVWRRSEDEVERFLHILESPGFKSYQHSLREATHLNVESSLYNLVTEYSGRMEGRTTTVGPELAPWISRFQSEIPKISINDFADARTLLTEVMPYSHDDTPVVNQGHFEKWLSDYKEAAYLLMNNYRVPEGPLSDSSFDISRHRDLGLLKQNATKELSEYLQNEHKDIEVGRSWSAKFLLHPDGFVHGYAKPIIEVLRTDGPTMNRFLAQYGKDLSEIPLASLSDHDLRHSITRPEKLIEDPHFSEFLDQEFNRYPGLQRALTIHQVFELAAAFDHRKEYESLNDRLLCRSSHLTPDLTLKDFKVKEEVLSTLDSNGYDKITVDPNKIYGWGTQNLEEIIPLLNSPEAKELYEVLTKRWGLDSIDIGEFDRLLQSEPEEREFFLDLKNSTSFGEIAERYALVDEITREDFKAPTLASLISNAPDIVENSELLLRPGVAEFFQRYDDRHFKAGPDGVVHSNPYGLTDIVSYYRDMIESVPLFQEAATILEDRYGYKPHQILSQFREERNIEKVLQQLRSPEFQRVFTSLNYEFLKKADILQFRPEIVESFTPESRLSLARAVVGNHDVTQTIRKVIEVGYEPKSANALNYLIYECYNNRVVREALNDPTFIELTKQLNDRFYGGTTNLARLREYAELHSELKDDSESLQWLLSPDSEKVAQFLGHNFRVATERPSTLRPLLQVGKDLNFQKFTGILDTLRQSGEVVSSNDIVFLSEISKHSDLLSRLRDRPTLVQGLTEVYAKQAFPRQHLDELGNMLKPSDEMDESDRLALEAKRKKISDAYTERPSLEDLSNLQLLRISLIHEMLERDDIQHYLGNLIAKDITTKKTELGGTILLNGTVASLRETESKAQSDGNFVDHKYPHFINGIATFHLHALEKNMPEWTGPSGYLGSGAADVGWVDEYNVTDTVFSAMGHPVNADGEPQTDKLRVNADVYFVDKRDPRNPKLRIIDLGEKIVPFPSE